jgi:CRISPR/Cas system Type II protein with McrA/HNH and RuvC-like nuclease domain
MARRKKRGGIIDTPFKYQTGGAIFNDEGMKVPGMYEDITTTDKYQLGGKIGKVLKKLFGKRVSKKTRPKLRDSHPFFKDYKTPFEKGIGVGRIPELKFKILSEAKVRKPHKFKILSEGEVKRRIKSQKFKKGALETSKYVGPGMAGYVAGKELQKRKGKKQSGGSVGSNGIL